MKIKEFPQQEKPRERLRTHGPQALSDAELLALILGQGTQQMNVVQLARDMLRRYDLEDISRQSASSLMQLSGVGLAKASSVVAAFELGRRAASFTGNDTPAIDSPERVFGLLAPRLSVLQHEQLVALYLDTRKKLLKQQVLFSGTLDASIIHPREIYKYALAHSASSVIIAHNHPSGNPHPSREDIQITKQIHRAGQMMGIPLVDHVIIGKKEYVSLRESGNL